MKAKELFPGVFSRHARAYKERQDRLRKTGGLQARRMLVAGVRVKPSQRVLDLACGPGTLTLELARGVAPGGEAIGIDLAAGMLDIARESAAGLPVRFEAMDIQELRFPDAGFDAVTCGHGLQFVADLDRALSEARRVLARGGRFGATVPYDRSTGVGEAIISRVAGDRLPPGPDAPDRAQTRAIVGNPDAFRRHVEHAGFRNVSVQQVDESHRWKSPADLIEFSGSWWALAARLEQLSPNDRRGLLAEAQRALEAEHGTGPIDARSSSTLLLADA
jgi:SAM-dependent methyltransferase